MFPIRLQEYRANEERQKKYGKFLYLSIYVHPVASNTYTLHTHKEREVGATTSWAASPITVVAEKSYIPHIECELWNEVQTPKTNNENGMGDR